MLRAVNVGKRTIKYDKILTIIVRYLIGMSIKSYYNIYKT